MGHVLLAILLTWLTLTVAVYIAMFAVGLFTDGKAYTTLRLVAFWLVAPILVPGVVLYRQYRRWRRAFRMARMFLRTVEIDMTALPADEQRAFIARLHSDEDRKQIAMDAMKRIRERQEASK